MDSTETNDILREILKWQRLQGIGMLRKIIPQVLDTEKKRMVYEMTDGKTPRSQIVKALGVSSGTVTRWWSSWFAYGILTRSGRRYAKIISLRDLGEDKPHSTYEGEE